MKFLLVLLAFVAAANSYEFQERLNIYDRSVSSQINDYIESLRKQMPCGFPGLGLGPLSPARLSHRDMALNSSGLAMAGEIDDFILYGLDDFDFLVKINLVLSRVNFNFHWKKVHFDTKYKMEMDTNTRLNAGRNGGAKFAIEDLKVVGSAKYNIIGKLRLREFKVSATIGDVNSEIENLSKIKIVNKKLNQIIEEWILLAVNENTSEMEEMANSFVVPFVNDLIGDASLTDVIAIIAGGGGGGGSGGETEECVPPVAPLTDEM